jgi:hypothetical protein
LLVVAVSLSIVHCPWVCSRRRKKAAAEAAAAVVEAVEAAAAVEAVAGNTRVLSRED